MAEQEGVIKYRLVYRNTGPLFDHDYSDLDRWHRRFKQAGVLGQDPARYGGLGFGNLSERIDESSFLVSGTQTGHLDFLTPEYYALVTAVDIAANVVEARGPVKPSSESLTHAAVYALDPAIGFVFHVHSPDIWRARANLGISETAPDVAYGTPAMAMEIQRLYESGQLGSPGILAMAGHEDGIVGFGGTAGEAGESILRILCRNPPLL